MFIRAKDVTSGNEVNINSRNIVSFEPGANEGSSVIALANGRNVTVDLSNRALRHAVKKAQQAFGDPIGQEAPAS